MIWCDHIACLPPLCTCRYQHAKLTGRFGQRLRNRRDRCWRSRPVPLDRPCLMPAIVNCAQHCRFRTPTCVAVVECLLRPCSPRPLAWRGHNRGSKRSSTIRQPTSCVHSQQDLLGSNQNVSASHAPPSCPPGYQIRRARPDEADQVAELNAEVHMLHDACYMCSMWIASAIPHACLA